MTTVEYTKQDKEFAPEIQNEIEAFQGDLVKADAECLRQREKLYQPLWQKRDAIISKISGFWPQAISNCEAFAAYFDDIDRPLISKLKDIKIHRSVEDPRAAKVEFVFEDNEFLAENSLIKEFTLNSDSHELGSPYFDWTEDLQPVKTEIKWKSDEVNLCKLRPTTCPEDDDETFEPGSFFSSFFDCVHAPIANSIGQIIAETFYPMALEWYTGEAFDDDDDFEDLESDESEDDSAEEIDLEEKDKKPSKRQKTEQ